VLDPAGVTRTKALGSESMARKLRDALPGGEGALRTAVWEFMRPMLSPALVALNRDAFVVNESAETTVDLDPRAASDLDELGLDDEPDAEAAQDPASPPRNRATSLGSPQPGRPTRALETRTCLSFVNSGPLFASFQRVQGMRAGAPTAKVLVGRGVVCEGVGAVA
jgi:hypothetical protein